MNALSDLAAEVTAALGGPRGRGPPGRARRPRRGRRDAAAEPAPDRSRPSPRGSRGFGGLGGDAGDISRITLRLVEQIKGQAEQAAAAQGVSLNSWVAQAVQGALRGPAARASPGRASWRGMAGDRDGQARRLRGWVQG